MDPRIEGFFNEAKSWQAERAKLRKVLSTCNVTEAFKWGKVCYAFEGKNIAIIQPMKEHLAFMFFKGALMNDPHGVLQEVGPNSRSARRALFTSVRQINARVLKSLVQEAIAIEKSGQKVAPSSELVLVDELQQRLKQDRSLAAAFRALTPGRQRAYNLYFSGAKQSSTRQSRIEKCVAKIRSGKGLRD